MCTVLFKLTGHQLNTYGGLPIQCLPKTKSGEADNIFFRNFKELKIMWHQNEF